MHAKPWVVCTVFVLCGLTSGVSGQPIESDSTPPPGHLLRLRAGPAISDPNGTQHRILILADHSHWPPLETGCTCLALTAVSARISLPAGFDLVAVETPESLGPAELWYPAQRAVDGGWFLGLFALHESTASLPEAVSRHLWTLVVDGAAESEEPAIAFLPAPAGSDEVSRFYFSNGTFAAPITSAAAAAGFPTPTDSDLLAVIEHPSGPAPIAATEGGEMLLGGGESETPCNAIYGLGDLPLERDVDFFIQVPTIENPTIQVGVDRAIIALVPLLDPNAVAVVAVAPGVYNESVAINTQNWLGHLMLVSTVDPGPDSDSLPANVDLATRIDPLGLGPCILIYGALGTIPPSTGRVTIGWSVTEDSGIESPFPGIDGGANTRGWRGFDLVNGGGSTTPPFVFEDALGVSVRDVESPVEIRGCWIHGHATQNEAAYDGAGVEFNACSDAQVLQCDISDNEAKSSGSGILVNGSTARIGRCFIHDNHFSTDAAVARMLGGGIGSANSRLSLCSSFIYRNSARLGGGVAVTFSDLPFTSFWPESNTIYENSGAVATNNNTNTPYRGAGLWMGPDPDYPFVFPPVQHSIGLLRNRFRDNDITIPPGSPVGSPPPALNAAGGGTFIDVDLADGSGPLIAYPSGFPRSLIIGNAVWRNTAQAIAGGAYLGIWTSPDSVAFESNSFNNNLLQDTTSGRAADLYIPFSSAPAQLGYVDFTGGNQLIENTSSVFQSRSWFAQCDPSGVTPNPPLFPLSHLDDLFPAGCVSGNTSANLRPATSFCTDSDAKMFLRNPNAVDELPALGPGSPCIDQGSDWTAGGDSGLYPVFQFDLELDPRPNNLWDPGAEELTLFDFIRGDTNGDGTVNVADVIRLLYDLFPSGPPDPIICRDRGDTNDDGLVNIADAVYLLGYLFPPSGSPPNVIPPPFFCPPGGGATFCCGQDPTVDLILCNIPYSGTCP